MFFPPQKRLLKSITPSVYSYPISLFLPNQFILKGALLGLRQFLATESTLKMMKKAFYSTSEGLYVYLTSDPWDKISQLFSARPGGSQKTYKLKITLTQSQSKVKSTKITEKNHIKPCTYLRKNKIFH